MLDCFRVPGEKDCEPLYLHDAKVNFFLCFNNEGWLELFDEAVEWVLSRQCGEI